MIKAETKMLLFLGGIVMLLIGSILTVGFLSSLNGGGDLTKIPLSFILVFVGAICIRSGLKKSNNL